MKVIPAKTVSIKTNNFTISLDGSTKESDYCFLSHAHGDHLIKTNKKIICSNATRKLSDYRGCNINRIDNLQGVKLVDSGHILGSKGLIVEEEGKKLLFTGDFSLQDRGFIKGLKPIKCDTLIMESTFSKPYFVFPNFNDEIKKAKDFISDNIKKDYLTVIMGYPLGKSQELQYYFKDFKSNVHDKIIPYNKIYSDFNVDLGENVDLSDADVFFSPLMRANNNFFNNIRRSRGVKFAVFSGWNIMKSYPRRFLADAGFTISDHADFKDLLTVIHKSKADNIYINHGCDDEFISFLKTEGLNATKI